MTGIKSAAPVLFDLFNRLPQEEWFAPPYDDMIEIDICKNSGYLATPECEIEKQWIPAVGERYDSCPYHKIIQLDDTQSYQVNADCEPVSNMVAKSYFTLPPVMAWYYRRTYPDYEPLPAYRADCESPVENVMTFIRPNAGTTITLTKNIEGKTNETVFELAHKIPNTTVYWYLDEDYITSTKDFHEIALSAAQGKHIITAVDEDGNDVKLSLRFK
ncbi:multimodular transpeptidase-transglycosylase [Nonlabens ulvanivorans]|uniref:Multimodular transpeptidase-transglycosylase n=1 Tax=Nonlabens ulvanivorans TaxID=906888 RepID=A0A090WB51_NONUL|nr:multimodular transpeptidase-transglycosylase [Nonlabens ulvanivorans]